MIQAKDGGQVHPMPAFGVFAFLAEGFGLSPIIAFADVPSINFDDQSERRGSRLLRMVGQLLDVLPGIELGHRLSAPLLSLEALPLGFPMQGAAGQVQTQALGDQHQVFAGNLMPGSIGPILAGAAFGLTDAHPVGGPVRGPRKTVALHEGFQQVNGVAIFALPVSAQTSANPAQDVAGQMGHPYPRKDQKPGGVGQ